MKLQTHVSCLCALVLCFYLQAPPAARQAVAPTTNRSPQPTRVASAGHFEFHSDPWINLHHFLYQWSREDRGLEIGRHPLPMPERATVNELAAADRDAWLDAVKFYRERIAGRNHFDADMMRIKARLVSLDGDRTADPPDIIPGGANVLRAAMPIYLEKWWPRHDSANRRWIDNLLPVLRRHEALFVQLTTRVHESKWPATSFRVDVSAYENYRAGYTTQEGHIVMFSTDPQNQDLYSLEMVLHEIQHAEVILATTPNAMAGAFQAAGIAPPDNLWHAIIFATAGEFVRSIAAMEGDANYRPYWIREGFEGLDGWSILVRPVSEYWLPVVRNETSRTEGLAALARALKDQ